MTELDANMGCTLTAAKFLQMLGGSPKSSKIHNSSKVAQIRTILFKEPWEIAGFYQRSQLWPRLPNCCRNYVLQWAQVRHRVNWFKMTENLQRDEEVGVYGFIFFRDSHWLNVIIDEYDNLFRCIVANILTILLTAKYSATRLSSKSSKRRNKSCTTTIRKCTTTWQDKAERDWYMPNLGVAEKLGYRCLKRHTLNYMVIIYRWREAHPRKVSKISPGKQLVKLWEQKLRAMRSDFQRHFGEYKNMRTSSA